MSAHEWTTEPPKMNEYWIIGSVTHHDDDPELRFAEQVTVDGIKHFDSPEAARAAIKAAGLEGEFFAVRVPQPGHYTMTLED